MFPVHIITFAHERKLLGNVQILFDPYVNSKHFTIKNQTKTIVCSRSI